MQSSRRHTSIRARWRSPAPGQPGSSHVPYRPHAAARSPRTVRGSGSIGHTAHSWLLAWGGACRFSQGWGVPVACPTVGSTGVSNGEFPARTSLACSTTSPITSRFTMACLAIKTLPKLTVRATRALSLPGRRQAVRRRPTVPNGDGRCLVFAQLNRGWASFVRLAWRRATVQRQVMPDKVASQSYPWRRTCPAGGGGVGAIPTRSTGGGRATPRSHSGSPRS